MPAMRFSARLDTSHNGLPHPCKDARAVVDSLTGIHSARRKCLRCHQELQAQGCLGVSRGFRPGDSRGHAVGHERCYWEHVAQHGAPHSCFVATHAGMQATNNTWPHINAWSTFWALVTNAPFSAVSHKLIFSRHMLIGIFVLIFVYGSRVQNLSTHFSYTLYSIYTKSVTGWVKKKECVEL